MLRGLGLQLAGGADERSQGDVHEGHVLLAHLVAELADGLQERQALDVPDRAADLHDGDVGLLHGGVGADAFLDLVRDVRDDLHGLSEVVPAPLLGDDALIHGAGGDVGPAVQVLVGEALVVAEVEVGLGAVIEHEHLAVLERVHRTRVDVDVRVELLVGHVEAAGLEETAQRGGGNPLAEAGCNSPRDDDVFRSLRHSGVRC